MSSRSSIDDVVTVAAAVLYDPRLEPPELEEDIKLSLRSEKNVLSCGNMSDIFAESVNSLSDEH